MGNKPLEAAHPAPKMQAGGTAPKPKVAEKALRETPGKEISLSRSKKMDAPGQGVTTPNATAQQNALKLPYRFKPQQYFDSPQRAVQPTTAPKARVEVPLEKRTVGENIGTPGRRYKNRIPDQGEPGSIMTNPAGTTVKKYGNDGWVQKEFNKGHGKSESIPTNERSDHVHDYKPNPYHPEGTPLRQEGRPVRNKDKVDFGLLKK